LSFFEPGQLKSSKHYGLAQSGSGSEGTGAPDVSLIFLFHDIASGLAAKLASFSLQGYPMTDSLNQVHAMVAVAEYIFALKE